MWGTTYEKELSTANPRNSESGEIPKYRENPTDFKLPWSNSVTDSTQYGPHQKESNQTKRHAKTSGRTKIRDIDWKSQDCLYIPGKVENQPLSYLLDSGATDNILSRHLFNRLPDRIKAQLSADETTASLADGSGLLIYGNIMLTCRIRTIHVNIPFKVANISDDAILGMKFFTENKCTMILDQGILIMQDQSLTCTSRNGALLCNKVQIVSPTIVPPGSEAQLVCRLISQPAHPVGIVENSTDNHSQVMLAATLTKVSSRRRIIVRCLNPSQAPVTIRAGTTLGLFTPITDDKIHSPQEIPKPRGNSKEDNSIKCKNIQSSISLPEHVIPLFEQAKISCSSPSQEQTLARILADYQDIFSRDDADIGRTNLVTHGIPVEPGTRPIRQPPRRLGLEKDQEVERQVKDLVQRGLVEPTDSGWCSGVVLVKKGSGWRLCIDYRQLNAVTRKDAYPLPRIDDSLDALAGSIMFSTLDMASGYWQIPLDEAAQEKSAFITRGGLWKWKVLPFGLTSAPASFERLMEQILSGLQWNSLLLYLDDVIVFSQDFDTHIDRLETVFRRFRSAGLKLKPSKCELLQTEVKYLGHMVSKEGVSTDPEKVKAVMEWEKPKNQSDVRTFLGFVGYYRKFCPDYATVAKPLNRLTSKGAKFIWGNEEEVAFETLKAYITKSPVLAYPDFTKDFILDTDASLDGAGAVLSQIQDGEEKVISYWSKTFSPAERNYCVTRRELLAVVLAVKHFKPYLYGRKFVCRTDHASLQWLYRRKEPSHQVARWLEILSEFSFNLQHRAGIKHGNADGLSRKCMDCKQCTRIADRDGGPHWTQLDVMQQVDLDDGSVLVGRGATESTATIKTTPQSMVMKGEVKPKYFEWIRPNTTQGIDSQNMRPREPIIPQKSDRDTLGLVGRSEPVCYGSIRPNIMQGMDTHSAQLAETTYIQPELSRVTQQAGRSTLGLVGRSEPVYHGSIRPNNTQGMDTHGAQLAGTTNIQSEISKVLISSDLRKDIIPLQSTEGSDIAIIKKMVMEDRQPSRELISQGSTEFRKLCEMLPTLKVMDGILRIRIRINNREVWSIVCPREMRPLIIQQHHVQHHSGINKTYQRIKLTWYWPGMVSHIRRAVNSCEICQAAKHSRDTKTNYQQRLYAGRPWQVLSLDLVGPFQKTPRGNTMILVISDHFTRWKDAIAIPNGTTITIVETLEKQVFNYFGLPERIHTDRGAQFEGQLMKDLCKLWRVDKSKTTPYHPQGNGVVERGNKDLGNSLRSLLLHRDDEDWDLVLPHLTRSLRGVPHSFTGETPNFLMFGRELTLPDNLLSGPSEDLSSREEYAARIYNRLTEAYELLRGKQDNIRTTDRQEPPLFSEGDLVWIRNKRHKKGRTAKLQPKWIGPYKIIQANTNHTYVLEINERQSLEHEGRLKLHISATQDWARAPKIPELTRQPTRSGYPKTLVRSPEINERELPDPLEVPVESTDQLPAEKPQKLPTIPEETDSQVSVTPKEVKIEPELVRTEETPIAIIDSPEDSPEDSSKRTRRIPERFRDFVVYSIAQNETNSEAPPLDESEWPRLSGEKMRKRRNYPIKYHNWDNHNYPIRGQNSTSEDIKVDDQTTECHTSSNSIMRAKYLKKRTTCNSSSSSSASSSSSSSDSEQDSTMDKVLDNSLLQALQEQGPGEYKDSVTETREQVSKETRKTSTLSKVNSLSQSETLDLDSTNLELEDLIVSSRASAKLSPLRNQTIRISRIRLPDNSSNDSLRGDKSKLSNMELDELNQAGLRPSSRCQAIKEQKEIGHYNTFDNSFVDSLQGDTFVSADSVKKQKDLLTYIRTHKKCRTCDERLDKSPEEQRVHAWTHFTVHACPFCGFVARRSTSVYHHTKRDHTTRSHGVRIDRASWQTAREYIQIPKLCPPLPYDYRTSSRRVADKQKKKIETASKPIDLTDVFEKTRQLLREPVSPVKSPRQSKEVSPAVSPVKPMRKSPTTKPISPPRSAVFSRLAPRTAAPQTQIPAPVPVYVPTPIQKKYSFKKPVIATAAAATTTRTHPAAAEVQPYRMTHREQQQGIQSVNSQLTFLKHLKIRHIKSLADIDSQIARLHQEMLKYRFPDNTY